MAHELTHVVQDERGSRASLGGRAELAIGDANSPLEREADRIGDAISDTTGPIAIGKTPADGRKLAYTRDHATRNTSSDSRTARALWTRCRFQQISNLLAALPTSAHPGARKAEIWNAEDKSHAMMASKAFETDYGAKFPKPFAKIVNDVEALLAFYDFPAEHWVHLRTTNPIESTFATVCNRSKNTKGPGSRAAGIAMAYKLIEAAQSRLRAVNAPHLVALVRAGALIENGKLVERPGETITPFFGSSAMNVDDGSCGMAVRV